MAGVPASLSDMRATPAVRACAGGSDRAEVPLAGAVAGEIVSAAGVVEFSVAGGTGSLSDMRAIPLVRALAGESDREAVPSEGVFGSAGGVGGSCRAGGTGTAFFVAVSAG